MAVAQIPGIAIYAVGESYATVHIYHFAKAAGNISGGFFIHTWKRFDHTTCLNAFHLS